VGIL
jgi:hypothetical protein